MDSLTKKILFDSGLYPGNPLLPPVNNVGMVYIKEPMLKQAEMDLFDARVALRDFEEAIKSTGWTGTLDFFDSDDKDKDGTESSDEKDEDDTGPSDDEGEDSKKKMRGALTKLKESLEKLETAEAQYFVKRYGAGLDGVHRQVLRGWVATTDNGLFGRIMVNIARRVRAEFNKITEDTGDNHTEDEKNTITTVAEMLHIWQSALGSWKISELQDNKITELWDVLDVLKISDESLRTQLGRVVNMIEKDLEEIQNKKESEADKRQTERIFRDMTEDQKREWLARKAKEYFEVPDFGEEF